MSDTQDTPPIDDWEERREIRAEDWARAARWPMPEWELLDLWHVPEVGDIIEDER